MRERSAVGVVVTFLCLALAAGAGQAMAAAVDAAFEVGVGAESGSADILGGAQAGPDWGDLFAGDGLALIPQAADPVYGPWPVFIADDTSLDDGLDFSALAGAEDLVVNAAVAAEHDIGNAYAYSALSGGDLMLFAGAERLDEGDSSIDFEFNQEHASLGRGGYGRGEPWQLVGRRTVGDLLVRLTFSGGFLASAEVYAWEAGPGEGYRLLEYLGGEGCSPGGLACAVSNLSPIEPGPWTGAAGATGLEIAPRRFVEFGVNASALLGARHAYDTIRVRTPQDIALAYFAEGN